ncbi:hypothetical protein ACWGCW_00490 [Streptomyces sp. NPDC054933]
MPAEPIPVSRICDGARLADIRKTALPGSDAAFLLAEIDRLHKRIAELTALLEQARIEAATAIGGAA